MASLMDTIKSSLAGEQAPTAGVGGVQTNPLQQLQSISRAKTGRQVQQTGPQASNLMQQVQAQQAQKAQQDQAQKGQMAALGLEQQQAAQEQQAKQQEQTLSQQLLEAQNQFTQRATDTYQSFAQKGGQLDLRKDKAKAEQLGFDLRLSNDKYINQLQSQGRKARLDSQAAFQEELARSIFAEERDLFEDSLDFRRLMNAEDREFIDRMAQMDVNFALEMAEAQNKAASSRMIWQGLGSVASGAAQAYGSGMFSKAPLSTSEGGLDTATPTAPSSQVSPRGTLVGGT